jgi:NhaA family Na+:H+ antiporter
MSDFQAFVDEASLQTLVQRRASLILTPLESFICKQAAAGVLLLLAIAFAFIFANSYSGQFIETVAKTDFGFYLGSRSFHLTIVEWIGDGLLALFFFLVGLEIKREMLIGQLRQPRQAIFVAIAAAGGMIVPALFYWTLNYNGPGYHGWAIPMTTDTAFAIGILTLLARHVSISASIFLTALAIIDDVITIAIIAIFYTHEFDPSALLKSSIPLALLFGCNIAGIRKGWIYAVLGVVLWWYIHESGVHATLAGLLMALAVPAVPQIGHRGFMDRLKGQMSAYEQGRQPAEQTILTSHSQHVLASEMGATIRSASTPLQSWHSMLANPIAILVLPLFALFNAGMQLSVQTINNAMSSPISLGIILGLVVGKPLGIALFSWLALKGRIARMPESMTFAELAGIGMLAGIGFTMSLFIVVLGFGQDQELVEPAKIGILISSVLSAFLGSAWLLCSGKSRRGKHPGHDRSHDR